MVIGQLIDGERIVIRCPSYDNFVVCKITKQRTLLQAFTQQNYVVDFAFPVHYFCNGIKDEHPREFFYEDLRISS